MEGVDLITLCAFDVQQAGTGEVAALVPLALLNVRS